MLSKTCFLRIKKQYLKCYGNGVFFNNMRKMGMKIMKEEAHSNNITYCMLA